MSEVIDYRQNLHANKRWSRMDTHEQVIGRANGLPVTVANLGVEGVLLADTSPCEYIAPPSDSA